MLEVIISSRRVLGQTIIPKQKPAALGVKNSAGFLVSAKLLVTTDVIGVSSGFHSTRAAGTRVDYVTHTVVGGVITVGYGSRIHRSTGFESFVNVIRRCTRTRTSWTLTGLYRQTSDARQRYRIFTIQRIILGDLTFYRSDIAPALRVTGPGLNVGKLDDNESGQNTDHYDDDQ